MDRSIYLDWRESYTPLEQVLEQARCPRPNVSTYHHKHDYDHSNGKVKRIQFEYPFIYLPKGVDLSLDIHIDEDTGIDYLVECYVYTGEKIDIPFPYSDERKYNISPDIDQLDKDIHNRLLLKDEDTLLLEIKLYYIDNRKKLLGDE